MKNAWDFVATLGTYIFQRLKANALLLISGIHPVNGGKIMAGLLGLLYIIAVVVFFVVLLYDGFRVHQTRNFWCVVGCIILFALTFVQY